MPITLVSWRGWTAVVLVVLAVTACGGANGQANVQSSRPPVPNTSGAVPQPAHIMIVIFENKAYRQVIDNPAAPYLSSLARGGANFGDAHGETHPSQPNYVALLSGSTHGVTNDSCPQDLGDQPNLARQLLDAHLSFAGYSEDQPAAGFTGCRAEDRYARKHNPWVDFSNVPPGSNLPASALPADLAALPTVSVLIPNLCHDMHDCPVSVGDRWARQHLPVYLSWAQKHNSLLIVTFDEDNGTAANHIPTVFVGPMVHPGLVTERIDHYRILRTIEDMYRLPPLGQAAVVPPITSVWARPAR